MKTSPPSVVRIPTILEINNSKERLLAVSADDIMGVANKYLFKNNSSVAVYHRSGNAEPVDEELSAFGPQEQMMIKQSLAELETIPERVFQLFN